MSRISIIVPVYNVERYLRRCVDSILSQTFIDFELILVDDGSPDNCPSMCDEYAKQDSRIHVIHQKNGGLSAARNAGIDWTFLNNKCEWITFIDSDDWVHERYLESLYNANINNSTKISVTDLLWTYSEDIKVTQKIETMVTSAEDAYTDNGKCINAYACGRLYHISLFKGIRFPLGKLFEDTFVTNHIFFSQEFVSVVYPSLYFYYKGNEKSILNDFPYDNIDNHEAFNQQIEYFLKHGYEKAAKVAIRKYLSEVHERLQRYKKDKYTGSAFYALKLQKKNNFKRYAKYLDPNNPQDEFVLYKIFPFRMKLYIYWRGLKNKTKK